MSCSYTNIDNAASITKWPCPFTGSLYIDALIGSVEQRYTKIIRDVPIPVDGNGNEIEEYWIGLYDYKTQFSVSASFRPKLGFREDSVVVYFGGVGSGAVITDITILPESDYTISDQIITINTINGESLTGKSGYLWVSYLCSDLGYLIGPQKEVVEKVVKVIAENVSSPVKIEYVTRARRVANRIEDYLGMIPTIWVGGPINNIKSVAQNILPNNTPLYSEHILEIQESILSIEDYLMAQYPGIIGPSIFTQVNEQNVFMVEYIHEIFSRLNGIENALFYNNI